MFDKKPKIVLVCMDEFINDVYKSIFATAKIDFHVVSHTDKHFVKKMAELMPDLILMGIIMIDLDGFKLTEELKDDSRAKHIRIIGFSNISQEEEIKKCLRSGMEDYWNMTEFAPEEVAEKINNLFQKQKYV